MTRICVPVCVSRVSELPNAVRVASAVADIVEVRLDYLSESELNKSVSDIRRVLESRERPIILTLRPAEYGGRRAISVADRLFFRIQNAPLVRAREPSDYWDLELDLALILQQRRQEGNDVVDWGQVDWGQTICSHHDFVGVPHDLDQIYNAMAATPAAIIKIAVQADDATDCLPIFRLLKRAEQEGRELIAIAMGDAGIMTRILGPSRGSFLTYGSLSDENATAPGQLTATDLRELYRIDQIDRGTEIIGIMGLPVAHSLSPRIHNAAFAASGINAVYLPFEVRDAIQFIRRLAHPKSRELDWNLRGLSVTAPHKSIVMSCLDWIEPRATEIGAVNTIVIQGVQLHGYNTDAAGFILPLCRAFGSLEKARCAIIGAGGAARACSWALRQEGAEVKVLARNPEKAKALAEEFNVQSGQLTRAQLSGFDIVINATPLGLRGELQNETPATAEKLRGVRLAYDLVYNPLETRFIREARDAGCQTLSGIEMLLAQAVEQFKLWTGKTPDIEVMRSAALAGRRLNDL
jgi:3-dehydroquinate dehydratase/shikimate dehydrogenase